MNHRRIGYIRLGITDSKENEQLNGLDLDKVFIDQVSCKEPCRPELDSMKTYVQREDILYIESMNRVASSLKQLLGFVSDLIERGVKIEFLKEKLSFSGGETPDSL